jgi:hypothetical protein
MKTIQAQFDRIAAAARIDTSPAGVRQRVEAMETVLERLFVVPGLNRPVGLDVILDFIPGIGPVASAAMGAWIVWEARNLGLSKWQMTRMSGNVGIDMLLGAIPIIGAIPDFFFRSNSRNLKIIKRHLDRHHPGTQVLDGEIVRGR